MDRERIRICVMRVGGSNRDADAASCLEDLGVNVEVLHLNDILRRRNLSSYNGLVIPGGFGYGDYVRAGAIWAKRIQAYLKEDLRRFDEAGKPIIGICNGFQVLVEAGLLPGFEMFEDPPKVALANNKSAKFECRWVYARKNENTKCIFTTSLKPVARFPVAHGEGRFIVQNEEVLKKLEESNQIVLRYCMPNGTAANGAYPLNPNGSVNDIAGICNPSGTVFGLMPHPEDAYWGYQVPDWTSKRSFERNADGLGIFQSMVEHIEKKF
jgi:phosphoribosylformylglycinamidine synthase I